MWPVKGWGLRLYADVLLARDICSLPVGIVTTGRGNLEWSLPAGKRPLWMICRPWPTSFLRRMFALVTPCLSDHLKEVWFDYGVPSHQNYISCDDTTDTAILSLSLLTGISSFPAPSFPPATPAPSARLPSSAAFNSAGGWTYHVFVDCMFSDMKAGLPRQTASQAATMYMAAHIRPFDL